MNHPVMQGVHVNAPTYVKHARLLAWAEHELAECRRQLESATLDAKPESSIRLRARIGQLKDLLAIPESARKAHS